MKISQTILLASTILCTLLTACDNTPTTLTVVNNAPSGWYKVLEEGKTDSTLVYRSYTAKIYYGYDNILIVESGATKKRKLESNMMNRPVKHIQVDLVNQTTGITEYPLYYDAKCMFESDWEYTLTITKDGCTMTRQMIEGAK